MSWMFDAKGMALASSALVAVLLLGSSAVVGDDPHEAVEKGAVRWSDDLDAAKKTSAESGRPIFLLFQEIPG